LPPAYFSVFCFAVSQEVPCNSLAWGSFYWIVKVQIQIDVVKGTTLIRILALLQEEHLATTRREVRSASPTLKSPGSTRFKSPGCREKRRNRGVRAHIDSNSTPPASDVAFESR
jgi:hypothetical protein